MSFQTVFKRYELKYLLTKEQEQKILDAMAPYMDLDEYGRTCIRNIYYDTDDYRLIRHSIDKPVYKEKLRVRSYNQASDDSTVFVELKKKYDSVVYKRRLPIKTSESTKWLDEKQNVIDGANTQIVNEVDYFLAHYENLHKVAYISYERRAYFTKEKSDFRVTFDDTILCRDTDLSLSSRVGGISILPKEMTLMEIKCAGGLPLWMARTLSENGIYKSTFSKYGMAYKLLIYPKLKKDKEMTIDE